MKKWIVRITCAVLVFTACSLISLFAFIGCVSKPRPAQFDTAYIEKNTGTVQVEIPEVFELANVAISITDYGLDSPYGVRKEGEYYEQVKAHFLPYKDHPLIAAIEPPDDNPYTRYYAFRDNSARYVFEGNSIRPSGLYPKKWAWFPDLFTKHVELVEDFASESGFREFYRDNLLYYEEQIRKYKETVPVKRMWTWLEQNFPQRYDSYKVVFSPLVGGSHSTQRCEDDGFKETVMFVSGPGESSGERPARVREGLLSRVVFTEIDHNYVNPITWGHWFAVGGAFRNVNRWNQQQGYHNPIQTFNEYMTWAVFILYAHDYYEGEELEEIERITVDIMAERREFVRIEEFNDKLLELYQNRAEGQTIPDLYPEILVWAEKT